MADQILMSDSRPRFTTLRDWLSVVFNHRRLVMLAFAGTFLGAILFAVLVVARRYEASMRIIVNSQRVNPAVTPEPNAPAQVAPPVVTEEELNSEVELIKSNDLLREVVVACGLADKGPSWLSRLRGESGSAPVARATHALARKLKVNLVKKTNLIEITYASSDPERAAKVLQTLSRFYMAKHVEVHRPPGASDFFEQQAEQYRKRLSDAEAQLGNFSQGRNVVAAELERDITVQKLAESAYELQQTQAAAIQTEQRIRNLERQAASTPDRVNTQQHTSDSSQLLEQLKATLLNLQLRRTELLTKFDASYPLVKQAETQIAQTQEAITKAEQTPIRDQMTDRDQTHELLRQELARARADLASYRGRATAMNNVVHHYQQVALQLGQSALSQQDLMRQVKANEGSYLLYVQKAEQERASDALDARRIVNVAVAEAAGVPVTPAQSPFTVALIGFFVALSVGIGAAFVAEYMDGSFRTPDEVREFLDLPVIASVPKDGEAPVFIPGRKSGGYQPGVNYDA